MKDLSSAIILFFLLLFAFTKFVGPIPFSVHSVTTTKTDTFSVSGEGKVTIIPDIAIVSVGVSAQGATVTRVQQELNTKINAISDAIKKIGVDNKDIKTSYYNVSPTYDYSSSTQKITGYTANSNLTIKVRNIDNANTVIDTATAQGANKVGGVRFDIDDKTKAENQARQHAVIDAKTKANAASKAAGFKLGKVINYSEIDESSPRIGIYDTAKALPMAGGGEPTQVEPGSSELTINVTLSYEIL